MQVGSAVTIFPEEEKLLNYSWTPDIKDQHILRGLRIHPPALTEKEDFFRFG
ncbi:MAG: hypothetical protein Ct9H300mP28_32120 [Pseudomonadota bacterium]|nr:MAG: hypothetical protein Ct9H300mP28_32120 [Pseudomonadota bacterium]